MTKFARTVIGLGALTLAVGAWVGIPRSLLGGTPQAYVECTGSGLAGVTCSIDHRGGSSPIHACWDFVITCATGNTVSSHACGDVAPASKSSVVMPLAGFAGIETCQIASSKLVNLALSEQP